jgi:hypothetical protein
MDNTCEVCGGAPHTPCDECGKVVHVGDWPICPHPRAAGAGNMGMLGEFKPYVDEHLQHEPQYITSLAERKRAMKANNLDYAGRKVGMPGCEV